MFAVWSTLLIKTYCGSKLSFVYVLSAIFLPSFILGILLPVFSNWLDLGPGEKNLAEQQWFSIYAFYWIFFYATNTLSLLGHWFFCIRYLEVAEKLATVTKSIKVCSPRCLTITKLLISLLIIFDGIIGMIIAARISFRQGFPPQKFTLWSVEAFETLSITLDCFVLLFAVIRVKEMLKKIADVSLNIGFMTLHVVVLVLLVLL
jgi:hypothetical protein